MYDKFSTFIDIIGDDNYLAIANLDTYQRLRCYV